jgi:hypothetical protein
VCTGPLWCKYFVDQLLAYSYVSIVSSNYRSNLGHQGYKLSYMLQMVSTVIQWYQFAREQCRAALLIIHDRGHHEQIRTRGKGDTIIIIVSSVSSCCNLSVFPEVFASFSILFSLFVFHCLIQSFRLLVNDSNYWKGQSRLRKLFASFF